MSSRDDTKSEIAPADQGRRELLKAAGAGVAVAAMGGALAGTAGANPEKPARVVRWGIVGTGGIANRMAPSIHAADGGELAAVSSRRMESAREFAEKHGVPDAFDDWKKMIASDKVDAVYLAVPTSVCEEIAIAASGQGKHVLVEKPFASLGSVERIVAACRENGVGFMDGTHFPHLARTRLIRKDMPGLAGRPWSLDSAFQFNLGDRGNIRYNTKLEPMGAIGDAGWYNMRAAVEFLPDDVELLTADTRMNRDPETGACLNASGVLRFADGTTSTWNCGFNSGSVIQELRITGPEGVVWVDEFVFIPGQPEMISYRVQQGWESREVEIPYDKNAPTLMYEDFALMLDNPEMFEASVRATMRTQALLDAAWESALANET